MFLMAVATAPLAAPKTHRVRVEFVRVFLLAAHRALLAGARRRPATNSLAKNNELIRDMIDRLKTEKLTPATSCRLE